MFASLTPSLHRAEAATEGAAAGSATEGAAANSATEGAAVEAAPAAPRPHRRTEEWPVDGALRLAGGRALVRGVSDGWYGRAELGPRLLERRGGPLLHVTAGLEGWLSGRDGGGAIPLTAQVGYVLSVVYLAAGAGVNVITFDQVGGLNGLGVVSPVAAANVGLTLGRVSLLADVRAQYRWQAGASDRRVYLGGLALDVTL